MQLSAALAPLFDYPIAELLTHLPDEASPDWDRHRHRQLAFAQQSATRSIVMRWLSNDWHSGQEPIVLTSSNPGAARPGRRGLRPPAEDAFRRRDRQAVHR